MKHADILKLPIGTQVVVSDRTDDIRNANERNSIIAILKSHDNFHKPYWSGLYWRPMTETFGVNGDSSDRVKRYHLTTVRTYKDNDGNDITETLQTLVSGKEILGEYTPAVQQAWDERDKERKQAEEESDRLRAIEEQVAVIGRAEAIAKNDTIRATLESLVKNQSHGITVSIRHDSTRWLDEEKTRGVPKLSGHITLTLDAVEELIERVYAELDAR